MESIITTIISSLSPSAFKTFIFDVFNQNSKYYDEMMKIILESKVNPPEKGHIHHIIPRCWFNHFHFTVDNSISNTVLLSYENHKKVHILAYKCAKESWLKSKLACAAHLMGDKEATYTVSEETRKKMSESLSGDKNPFYGKHISPEHREKMVKALREKGAWNKGKHLSDESRRKMSESLKGRVGTKTKGCTGMRWFTNGITEVLSFECPDNFHIGRINRRRKK